MKRRWALWLPCGHSDPQASKEASGWWMAPRFFLWPLWDKGLQNLPDVKVSWGDACFWVPRVDVAAPKHSWEFSSKAALLFLLHSHWQPKLGAAHAVFLQNTFILCEKDKWCPYCAWPAHTEELRHWIVWTTLQNENCYSPISDSFPVLLGRKGIVVHTRNPSPREAAAGGFCRKLFKWLVHPARVNRDGVCPVEG